MTWRTRVGTVANKMLAPFGAELRPRRSGNDHLWEHDASFVSARERVCERTLMTPQRMYVLWQLARQAAALPHAADSAEVGAWRGGASYLLAEINRPRAHFVLDTFSGLPEADADRLAPGAFAASVDEVRAFLAPVNTAVVLQGLFPESAAPLVERRFSFVHLDVDLYSGTRAGLEFFLPRMVAGGVIVVDDYGSRHEGVTQAVHEVLAARRAPLLRLAEGQCAIISYEGSP